VFNPILYWASEVLYSSASKMVFGVLKMDLIQQLEQEEIARLGRNIPDFAPGDTVVVTASAPRHTKASSFRVVTAA
jgi:hypothetical protein